MTSVASSMAVSDARGDDSIYPPKCKRSRKLWHDLLKFKKAVDKGQKTKYFDLPPDSSYMRACAHHFAQRLGMRSESIVHGTQSAVRVHVPPACRAMRLWLASSA